MFVTRTNLFARFQLKVLQLLLFNVYKLFWKFFEANCRIILFFDSWVIFLISYSIFNQRFRTYQYRTISNFNISKFNIYLVQQCLNLHATFSTEQINCFCHAHQPLRTNSVISSPIIIFNIFIFMRLIIFIRRI